MTVEREALDTEFAEAANNWNLERLYIDLAAAKGRGLTPLEKKFLQALLCGYSPAEIADRVYQSSDSSAVRVYLCNGIYKYIRELFVRQTGETIQIRNWSRVTNLLEKAGYKRELHESLCSTGGPEEVSSARNSNVAQLPLTRNYQDWEERIAIEGFLGRKAELAELKQWIVGDRCRLVGILGMGGVGKTALAVKLVEQIQADFEYVIWRSLRNAPPLEELLVDLIEFLSGEEKVEIPGTTGTKISLLMSLLRSRRSLIVLDSVESILASGERAGTYREDCTEYGELLRRIGEERHRSCGLLVSREQPQELVLLEGEDLAARSCYLDGLKTTDALKLAEIQTLAGSEQHKQQLVKQYANNPLVLKRVALTIKDCFQGDAAEFLAAGMVLSSDIRALLDRQFARLSPLERRLLDKLALAERSGNRRASIFDLDLGVSPHRQLDILESLQRRMLIEKNSTRFRQQPLLSTYIVETLIDRICARVEDRQTASLLGEILCEALIGNNPPAAIDRSEGITAA